MNEEEKIKEILASLDPQLQVDAIRIVEQSNTDDKERKVKFFKRILAKKQKDNYPKDEKKLQQDKEKYTESFRKAVEEENIKKKEEKIRKEAEKEKIRKIISAYEKTSIREEDINRLYQIYETKISTQTEKRRTFLMLIKEILGGKEKNEQENQGERKINNKEQFVQGLRPKTMITNNFQQKKVSKEKGIGLEK